MGDRPKTRARWTATGDGPVSREVLAAEVPSDAVEFLAWRQGVDEMIEALMEFVCETAPDPAEARRRLAEIIEARAQAITDAPGVAEAANVGGWARKSLLNHINRLRREEAEE